MISTAFLDSGSFLHRADARIKFTILILWTAAFLVPSSMMVLLRYYAGIIILIAITLSPKQVLLPLKSIWPVLMLVLVITPPFHTGGTVLFQIGTWYSVTMKGLEEAGILIFRFSGITSAFFLFFRTTSIDQFILALQWYGLPYNAALVVTIAFRYIPSLVQLYRNIQDAHTLRRAPLKQGRFYNPVRRFSHLFPSLVSVMIHSIKSIPTLSMALEIRGFERNRQRSTYKPLPGLKMVVYQFPAAIIVLLILILSYFL